MFVLIEILKNVDLAAAGESVLNKEGKVFDTIAYRRFLIRTMRQN